MIGKGSVASTPELFRMFPGFAYYLQYSMKLKRLFGSGCFSGRIAEFRGEFRCFGSGIRRSPGLPIEIRVLRSFCQWIVAYLTSLMTKSQMIRDPY